MRFRRVFFSVYSRVYNVLWDNALTAAVAEEIVSALEGVEGPVLEVGSGTGLITGSLLNAGFEVVPSEPDPAMRARYQKRNAEPECQPRTIAEMPDKASGFAAVVAANVLHMVPAPEVALADLMSRVATTGVVVVASPTRQASVPAVLRAMKRRGIGVIRRAAFWAIHLLLGPIRTVSGAGISNNLDIPWPLPHDKRSTIEGVTEVIRWRMPDRSDTDAH